MNAKRHVISIMLVVFLWCVAPVGAELIQWLDASVPESVVLYPDGSGVQQWKDLSGKENHAIEAVGTVTYDGTAIFPGGPAGLDFGLTPNSLELWTSEAQDQWLDQSAGTGGFTVVIVSYTTAIHTNWNDLIGTRATVGGQYGFRYGNAGQYQMYMDGNVGGNSADGVIEPGDTTVWTQTYNATTGEIELWTNQSDPTTGTRPAADYSTTNPVTLGRTHSNSRFFMGYVGEVQIYDNPLSQAELDQLRADLIYKWVTPLEEKLKPGALVPSAGSVEMPIDGVVLSWTAGIDSVEQVVYFGTDANAVAHATPESPEYIITQTETSYALPTLNYGTTYYYRIDSISDAVYSSDVTGFTTEFYAYPLEADYITAAASSTLAGQDPNNTCNSVGLDPNDAHNTNIDAMWLSSPGQEGDVWIQYDFETPVLLNEAWIWNHNTLLEDLAGFGISEAKVEYTMDGENWMILSESLSLNQAPVAPEYVANNFVPFGDVVAQGVRITALSSFEGIVSFGIFGLSEVQFQVVPVQAADPGPANGQLDVAIDPTLSWTAGRGATSRTLYWSDDEEAVRNETVDPILLQETSYELAALDVNTVYYWKVNENIDAEVWTGNLWSFTTVSTQLFDGMEAYTPGLDSENPIWATWEDGLGADGSGDPNENGSLVGADPNVDDFDPERTVVRSGNQSLPIWFNNTVAPISTVTRTFTEGDIPDVGAKRMLLYYQFGADSVGDALFVEINGVEVASLIIPENFLAVWHPLTIDLTSAGIEEATQMTSMTFGLRGANAKGVVYVDDVMLTN